MLADYGQQTDPRLAVNQAEELQPYISLVRPNLEDDLKNSVDTDLGRHKTLWASFALLPEDPNQESFLRRLMLNGTTTPDEFEAIHAALHRKGKLNRESLPGESKQ